MKKTGIRRLLELAGNAKPFMLLSALLSVLSALAVMVPSICVYFLIQNTVSREWGALTSYGWAAAGALAAHLLCYFSALICSHIAAFKTTRNVKSRLLNHLVTLPMGFHTENASGKLRKIIENNVRQMEGCIAPLPDIIAAVITPIATMLLLLLVDWRLGLLCLVPIAAGLTLQASMTPGGAQTGLKVHGSNPQS
ncbi:MAG: hypothetical protein LBT00_02855 [Spirochaetaceae bacterium]|jgi:ATP-binding cassette subfamily B protein|nr:hypothetical protein [Spirochaetaceae bacterium]